MSSDIWGLWDIIPLLMKQVFFWFVIICESSIDLHWVLEILLAQKNSATCIFKMYMGWFTVLTGGWLDLSVMANKMFSTARTFPGALDYYKACWYLHWQCMRTFLYTELATYSFLYWNLLETLCCFMMLIAIQNLAISCCLEKHGGRGEAVMNYLDDKNKFAFPMWLIFLLFLSFSHVVLAFTSTVLYCCVVLTSLATAACGFLMVFNVHWKVI